MKDILDFARENPGWTVIYLLIIFGGLYSVMEAVITKKK